MKTHKIMRSKAALYVIDKLAYPVLWIVLKTANWLFNQSRYLYRAALFASRQNTKKTKKIYRLMATQLTADRLTPVTGIKMKERGIHAPASATGSLLQRTIYNNGIKLPEWQIYSKLKGVEFAKILGLRTPEVYFKQLRFDEINPIGNVVIKPLGMYWSRGVFIAKEKDEVVEINTGKIFRSWDKFREYVKEMLVSKLINEDSWMVEQLITGKDGKFARDLKFFMFYGKIALTAEIIRYPKIICDLRDDEGNFVRNYLYKKDQIFKGDGISPAEKSLVENISVEIPCPFIRIDFLRGADGMYFGEFTPLPGHIGNADKESDQLMGEMFHEAQARLYADLLQGKKFEAFNQIASKYA